MTAHAFHTYADTQPTTSTAGLLLSLSAALPTHAKALRRRAAALAARLGRPHARALDNRAGDLLAQLLDATDCEDLAGSETEGCLDSEFDN